MKTIEIECRPCGGTGLYCGFAEPKGTAVICHGCEGSGRSIFKYTEFTRRKGRRGIKTVSTSIGTGVGPVGSTVSYKAFSNGAMPKYEE